MKILLTAAGGVVGRAVIPRLLRRRHRLRLLARGAEREARAWPRGVEPFAADVARSDELVGAAGGCDLVIHAAGVVAEELPEVTYRRVNVEGSSRRACSRSSAGRRYR